MTNAVFIELRLLSSAELDSRSLLTTVLAGDDRLPARLGTPALASLGTRFRARLRLLPRTPQELGECLRHGLAEAGQAGLMTDELIQTLSEHAGGNLRVMMNLAQELLAEGLAKQMARLDEKLYLEVFTPKLPAGKKAEGRKGRA